MACIFPQAPDLETFWRNILAGVDAVGEPLEAWEAKRYLASGRINTPFGGYLKDLYRFDPREFGIMPNSLDGGEPDQYLALKVARDALADSGYWRDDYDHRDTGIIIGHSTYLHRGQVSHVQNHIVVDQTLELLQAALPDLDDEQARQIRQALLAKLPPSNADNAPGLVPNVMTGRIANRLNLKGPNYILDAACSSSLLAVNAAMDELRNRRSRLMIAGGVNASLPAEVSVIFTQLGALSGRGKVRPFETGSDGTLLGEGLGMVVLKRLEDALADGDRIYAQILGVGQASDGRGTGLLAPSVDGETLAIQRAYEASGVDPASISLVEAHGTGIPLGDKTEIAALRNVLGERRGQFGSVALGSVKSMISHCIPAAGLAGLIKTALALHHKVLPPTLCGSVNPELGIEQTPLYVNTTQRPWLAAPGQPRRAGIDSFGFGGINTHAIVQEAPDSAVQPARFTPWPFELCLWAAADTETLIGQIQQAAAYLEAYPATALRDIAAGLAQQPLDGPVRLAIVADDTAGLAKKLQQALKQLQSGKTARWMTRGGAFFSSQPLDGKLAFLFPGEGSQYLNMFADLAQCFPVVREWFDFWQRLYPDEPGSSRTDWLFPPASELSPALQATLEARLHAMDVGSEAVFIAGQAMFALLSSLGVAADAMVGHSTGESSALAASGAMGAGSHGRVAECIRQLNAVYLQVLQDGDIATGALLTVGALPRATVEQQLAAHQGAAMIAMDNCDNQLVLFGSEESIAALMKSLGEAGGICALLPFDRAYHTPLFAGVSRAFLQYYRAIGLEPPRVPLYSCATAALFPGEADAVCELAAAQWSAPVRFRETIRQMHQDGVRYFIEVGPSGNLTGFVNDILAGQEYMALASNQRKRSGLEQLLTVLGSLFVNGKAVAVNRLFEPRACRPVDFRQPPAPAKPAMPLANTLPVLHVDEPLRALLQEAVAAAISGSRTGIPPLSTRMGSQPSFRQGMPETMAMDGTQGPGSAPSLAMDTGNPCRYDAALTTYPTPFLASAVRLDANRLSATCPLSVEQDLFLQNHIIGGTVSDNQPELLGLSCVPLTVSLEIMAEACALLAGSKSVGAIENVRAFDWIALDQGEVLLEVQAECLDPAAGLYRAAISNAGKTVMSAEYRWAVPAAAQPLAPLAEMRPYRYPAEELYQTGMFHGPIFQSIAAIAGWCDEGIDAVLAPAGLQGFFSEGETPDFVLNPVLLDALGQLIAYWIAQQVGLDFNSFPSTIARIDLHAPCPQDLSGTLLRGRQSPVGGNLETPRSWDFDCVQNGRTLLTASGFVNVYFPVPHHFADIRRDPLSGWLGRPWSLAGQEAVLLWQVEHLPESFCNQSSGIFLRILAHSVLSAGELEEWHGLRSNPRQARQWLHGRLCLKEAVRYWIYQQTGELLPAADIEVLHDAYGAPYVDGWWNSAWLEAPSVSLSHDNQASIAAVAASGQALGVDTESLGHSHNPDWLAQAFTLAEQRLLAATPDAWRPDALLRLWCAKEAAAKYCGSGLQGNPTAFEVSFPTHDWNVAMVIHEQYPISVTLQRLDDRIVALAGSLDEVDYAQ
jgi:acyl transferase domain-containing protein/phosphopantetheinyl transferase